MRERRPTTTNTSPEVKEKAGRCVDALVDFPRREDVQASRKYDRQRELSFCFLLSVAVGKARGRLRQPPRPDDSALTQPAHTSGCGL